MTDTQAVRMVPVETGVDPIYQMAYDSVRRGGPGLSDVTCKAIARSIYMKISLAAAPSVQPGAEVLAGKVTWHSTEEEGGPDVGLELNLGDGTSLWLGEGDKATGWQFSTVTPYGIIPVADVIDHDQARALFDRIAAALQPVAQKEEG